MQATEQEPPRAAAGAVQQHSPLHHTGRGHTEPHHCMLPSVCQQVCSKCRCCCGLPPPQRTLPQSRGLAGAASICKSIQPTSLLDQGLMPCSDSFTPQPVIHNHTPAAAAAALPCHVILSRLFTCWTKMAAASQTQGRLVQACLPLPSLGGEHTNSTLAIACTAYDSWGSRHTDNPPPPSSLMMGLGIT